MKNILIILEHKKNVATLLEKADMFGPSKINMLCFDSECQELQVAQLTKNLKSNCHVDLTQESATSNKEREQALKLSLKLGSWDLIVISRPLLGREAHDFTLVKTVLREASNSLVLLCGDKKWSTPVKVLAAVDVFEESAEQTSLNRKVLSEVEKLSKQLTAESSALSIIPISRISQELDVVEPSEVLSKKGKATKAKLDLFISGAIGNVACTSYVGAGSPSKEIPSVAKKLKADIVVMGNVARKGFQGLIIGNTAEKILTRLSVDALVVKS